MVLSRSREEYPHFGKRLVSSQSRLHAALVGRFYWYQGSPRLALQHSAVAMPSEVVFPRLLRQPGETTYLACLVAGSTRVHLPCLGHRSQHFPRRVRHVRWRRYLSPLEIQFGNLCRCLGNIPIPLAQVGAVQEEEVIQRILVLEMRECFVLQPPNLVFGVASGGCLHVLQTLLFQCL